MQEHGSCRLDVLFELKLLAAGYSPLSLESKPLGRFQQDPITIASISLFSSQPRHRRYSEDVISYQSIMGHLNTLPVEVLLDILQNLGHRDILRCQQVR